MAARRAAGGAARGGTQRACKHAARWRDLSLYENFLKENDLSTFPNPNETLRQEEKSICDGLNNFFFPFLDEIMYNQDYYLPTGLKATHFRFRRKALDVRRLQFIFASLLYLNLFKSSPER